MTSTEATMGNLGRLDAELGDDTIKLNKEDAEHAETAASNAAHGILEKGEEIAKGFISTIIDEWLIYYSEKIFFYLKKNRFFGPIITAIYPGHNGGAIDGVDGFLRQYRKPVKGSFRSYDPWKNHTRLIRSVDELKIQDGKFAGYVNGSTVEPKFDEWFEESGAANGITGKDYERLGDRIIARGLMITNDLKYMLYCMPGIKIQGTEGTAWDGLEYVPIKTAKGFRGNFKYLDPHSYDLRLAAYSWIKGLFYAAIDPPFTLIEKTLTGLGMRLDPQINRQMQFTFKAIEERVFGWDEIRYTELPKFDGAAQAGHVQQGMRGYQPGLGLSYA